MSNPDVATSQALLDLFQQWKTKHHRVETLVKHTMLRMTELEALDIRLHQALLDAEGKPGSLAQTALWIDQQMMKIDPPEVLNDADLLLPGLH